MDVFAVIWVTVPLSLYFLLIGLLQIRTRVTALPGFMDTLLLGFGLSGFVTIGPFDLMLPESAANRWGWGARFLVCSLYALLVTFIALQRRPRIAAYNADLKAIQQVLPTMISQQDPSGTLVGSVGTLPEAGIQFRVESAPSARVVQLVALRSDMPVDRWYRFSQALSHGLNQLPVSRNPRGFVLIAAGLLGIGGAIAWGFAEPVAVANAFRRWMYQP